MSYRLDAHEALPDGIRRIAREQLENALASLDKAAAGDDFDGNCHTVRKNCKKLRALVRLVRDEIGTPAYATENVCFRDAARRLSAVRDAVVLIETLDQIRAYFADELPEDAFAGLRKALHKRYKQLRQHAKGDATALTDVTAILRAALDRLPLWRLERDDYSAVRSGLRRVYKRGFRAMQSAWKAPTDANLHEWRKRAKYLWYHLRILGELWPNVMTEVAECSHRLTNLLGDDHDLAVLLATVHDDRDLGTDPAEYEALAGLVERRRLELQRDAWPLGRRLYAEESNDFVDRFGVYWQTMRHEARRDDYAAD